MKNIIVFLYVTLLAYLLVGCSGRHCLAIGGEKDGISGNIEYCYDFEETKQSGVPSFKKDDGKNIYGFSLDQIEAIKEKILANYSKDNVNINSTDRDRTTHPVKEILNIINNHKQ